MPKQFDDSFPEPYSHIEDLVYSASLQIQQMNETIRNLPDMGETLVLNERFRYDIKARHTFMLQNARNAYAREILNCIKEEMAPEDPDLARWVSNSASIRINGVWQGEKVQEPATRFNNMLSSSKIKPRYMSAFDKAPYKKSTGKDEKLKE